MDRKLREITYALELEKDYPKEKILQWYLNQISYADRYIGIQAAAQGYFHKDAADLTLKAARALANKAAPLPALGIYNGVASGDAPQYDLPE